MFYSLILSDTLILLFPTFRKQTNVENHNFLTLKVNLFVVWIKCVCSMKKEKSSFFAALL